MSQGWVGDGPHQNYSRDLKKYLFNCWLHTASIAALRLSLVVANRGYCLVAVHGLLIAVASLVMEHKP